MRNAFLLSFGIIAQNCEEIAFFCANKFFLLVPDFGQEFAVKYEMPHDLSQPSVVPVYICGRLFVMRLLHCWIRHLYQIVQVLGLGCRVSSADKDAKALEPKEVKVYVFLSSCLI